MIFSSIFKVNINMIEGPRTVLMNDCPKQNDQRKVSKKTIFYHENDRRFYPQVIPKRNFLIGHVSIKKYWLKTLFCYLTHRNSKSFTKVLHTGPRSAVGNVSGNRCESDCRSRGREFDPGPVPYFRGD